MTYLHSHPGEQRDLEVDAAEHQQLEKCVLEEEAQEGDLIACPDGVVQPNAMMVEAGDTAGGRELPLVQEKECRPDGGYYRGRGFCS